MKMKKYKLKPCPFCGGKAVLEWKTERYYGEESWIWCEATGHCTICTAQVNYGGSKSLENAKGWAVRLWNERVKNE